MRLLWLLGLLLTTSTALAAASGWQSLLFDGHGFVEGSGSGAILVRNGYLPVAAELAQRREDPLPERTGALAVYCYQQRSGGKLRPARAFAPMAGVAVTVTGGSLTVAGRSDASGYLILALPAGSYRLRLFGLSKEITLENGKTALAAMRGGKRMVD